MSNLCPSLVRDALAGNRRALSHVVEGLTPVIQYQVGRQLRRRGSLAGRDARQEVEDFTQEVFVALFSREAHTLLSWDPARGASLETFVGVVAERLAQSILRSGRRTPFGDRPEDPSTLEERAPAPAGSSSPEADAVGRETSRRFLDQLERRVTPFGLEMFHQLFIHGRTTEEIQGSMNMSAQAVYKWRSRLLREARQVWSRLDEEPPPNRPMPP